MTSWKTPHEMAFGRKIGSPQEFSKRHAKEVSILILLQCTILKMGSETNKCLLFTQDGAWSVGFLGRAAIGVTDEY